MATRMQQRRGTAAQWISTNGGDGPILEIGEIGFESDTGKFKMGDGVNHWIDLEYFINEAAIVTDIEGAISDTEKGAANGVATLDANSKLTASQIPTTVAPLASPTFTGTVSGITKSMVGLGNVDNTADADKPVSTATQTALNAKAPTASPTFTGTVNAAAVSTSGNVTVGGNLTVNGTTTTVNSTEVNVINAFTFEGSTPDGYETTLTITDPTADRDISLPDADGIIVLRNTSDTLTNKIISAADNVLTIAPTDLTGVVASASEINILDGATLSTAELNVLDGITSSTSELNILDGVTATTAEINVLDGILSSASELNILNGATLSTTELNYVDGVTSSIQSQLDGKAPNVSPTFTGNVSLPGTTTIGDISSTELNYVDGVTSAIQAQIDGKSATGHTHTISGITDITADAAEINKLDGLATTATELGYVSGVTSAIQSQLDAKVASSSLGSGVATFLSTPNSANLRAALSDETGTDLANSYVVFSVSPSIVTPNISKPRITSYAGDASIVFEGTTEDAYETSLTPTDPTADRTITLPDASGTVALTSNLDSYLLLAGGTMSGALAMGTNKITGLGDPTADQDAATKAYVDAATAGLNVHQSVKAATTANITLASAVENGDTLDGVTLATGNRILVKNQTTESQNGVYIVAASGAPTRATDYDAAGEVDAGDFIYVESGTVNGTTGWVQTNTITTVGTDAIAFTQFSGAGTYTAGTGLTLTGSTFSINTATTADLSTAQTLTNKTISGASNTLTVRLANDVTGTLPVANGGTGVTSSTGTGSVVLSSSPTLVTPALGTPSSATLTNATGLPVSTGISGLGTNVATFLATPSSSNLASALTDKTGTGNNVFATSPTLTTPTIGAATATSITFSGDSTVQSTAGVPSITTISQQTASYNLSTGGLTLRDNLIEINNAGATTLTIPANSTTAYPVGTSIDVLQTGAGQVTIAGAVGVTVNATPGLKLRAQWSSATLFKRATDTWVVMGDLSA